MAFFRRQGKGPKVVRKGVGDQAVVERTTRKIGGQLVQIKRVREPEAKSPAQPKRAARSKRERLTKKPDRSPPRRRARQPAARPEGTRPYLEVVAPPETDRKQMLVRTLPHQTQIVVLEGPVLVEHYVARSDKRSLVGNVYMGKVRNVLPGMEAAFIDFGEGKNGVLYAGDIQQESEENGKRRPRIEKAVSQGAELMVQVVKDPMGHKGARLTNEISLPGRYLVLAPGTDISGISRRLPDDERERLRKIINRVAPEDFGVIVRTAADGASEEDIRSDIERLEARWKSIEEKRAAGPAPRLLYEEPQLEIRVIREHFTRDFRRLLIDDEKILNRVRAYLEESAPDLVPKIKRYTDRMPLFERFHVEDQIRKGLDRKVWLPSGGHIVIESTEALTVIDVNTGRFVGHSNLEETVLQNNLEAAEEIARQLRLRDIGGIIVIDFIDMEIEKNRDAVLLRLREHLAKDRTRSQVFDVSNLGLVEMTRKNVSDGLLESFSEPCPHCSGRGVVLYEEAAVAGLPIPRGTRKGGSSGTDGVDSSAG